jgi:hypothetical protein
MVRPAWPEPCAPRPPNAHEREELALLREAFAHSSAVQSHQSSWWRRLSNTDRRLLLALCGLDDSDHVAARSWPQLSESTRDALYRECRRLGRLLLPISR